MLSKTLQTSWIFEQARYGKACQQYRFMLTHLSRPCLPKDPTCLEGFGKPGLLFPLLVCMHGMVPLQLAICQVVILLACTLKQRARVSDLLISIAVVCSSSHIVGIGLRGECPHGLKCWLYYPEDDCPFYRTTVFSHYAKNNCPADGVKLKTICTVCHYLQLLFTVAKIPSCYLQPTLVAEFALLLLTALWRCRMCCLLESLCPVVNVA